MMIRWEYSVYALKAGQTEIDALNELGLDGWMAWQMDRCPIDAEVVFHLMRPKRAEKETGD